MTLGEPWFPGDPLIFRDLPSCIELDTLLEEDD